MGVVFDRDALLAAFDEIGTAAVEAGTKLDIAVYGGSALMLASNFRFSSEDVDAVPLEPPWPVWLGGVVERIAIERGWSQDWFNDAVGFHLSKLADTSRDHFEFGSFPRNDSYCGLVVYVPSAEYLLALKLKAIRINDPVKRVAETSDILGLVQILDLPSIEAAIEILRRYFPMTRRGRRQAAVPAEAHLAKGEEQRCARLPSLKRLIGCAKASRWRSPWPAFSTRFWQPTRREGWPRSCRSQNSPAM